jgi:hypothetical protein
MAKHFRKMTQSDISSIVVDLDRWAIGQFGSKLTWEALGERFGFSRQSLQAKSEIKAAYDYAKKSLGSGAIKGRQEATQENQELTSEVERLKLEVAEYKRREGLWRLRWQRIAFHIRQKGIQVHQIDAAAPKGVELLSDREANKVLTAFDKEIPFSGRI